MTAGARNGRYVLTRLKREEKGTYTKRGCAPSLKGSIAAVTSGVNGYLAEPIDIQTVSQKLKRYVK